MNLFLLMVYVVLSTSGATLIKYGGSGSGKVHTLFNVPIVNVEVSLVSLIGIIIYGMSFLVFTILLNKLSMSYLVPVATGASYVLLMISAILVFNESFGLWKAIGCILILVGIMLVVTSGNVASSS